MDNKAKLELINKMALLRKGNIPVPIVILSGTKESIEIVAKDESEVLGEYFAILKKNVTIEPGKVYFVPKDESKDVDLSWLPKKYEIIEVNDLCFNWALFLNTLGLEGVSKETLLSLDRDEILILREHMDDIVPAVLYQHYEKYDDNTFNTSDLAAIKEQIGKYAKTKSAAAPVKEVAKEEAPVKNEAPTTKPQKKVFTNATIIGALTNKPAKEETPVKKEVKEEEPTKTEPIEEVTAPGFNLGIQSEIEDEDEPKEITMSEPMVMEPERNNEPEDEDTGLIAPKTVAPKKKEYSYNVKETLTREEIDKNQKLLDELHGIYTTTIAFMKDSCNARYRVLINKMQEALNTDIYKVQFTKEYLLEDDDTSTEVYHKLYDLDIATQKFQKAVIHQIKHIACFNCNHEWDEDITFLKPGYHAVICPKCGQKYPFEK